MDRYDVSMPRTQSNLAREAEETPPTTPTESPVSRELGLLSLPPMRYQSEYVWLIFFSSLDIMLTWAILRRGGEEVNPVANFVIGWWGLNGAIAFKFALMLFVIISCEIIGRRRDRAGRLLCRSGVVISAAPVVYSLGLLAHHVLVEAPAQ